MGYQYYSFSIPIIFSLNPKRIDNRESSLFFNNDLSIIYFCCAPSFDRNLDRLSRYRLYPRVFTFFSPSPPLFLYKFINTIFSYDLILFYVLANLGDKIIERDEEKNGWKTNRYRV